MTPFSQRFVQVTLLISGIIHVMPLIGLGGSDALARLYGLDLEDPSLLLLLQHRALMFGLLAVPMFVAIFRTDWQWPALWLALLSAGGFVILRHCVADDLPERLQRVYLVDLGLLVPLVIALGLKWRAAT